MNSSPSSNPWIGRFVGDNQRYRLDKRLGGGGMGEVFLATDTRVGQQVALKLLKDTLLGSGEMRKRFEREVAVCAALQSDHIVKVMDCGVTPEGYPFYVMEYLRGRSLQHLMQYEKPLSVERSVNIITQVCKGLQLAHRGVTLQWYGGQGSEHIQVVHRDLKPDNIYLIPTDLGEWVKILDFGIVKIHSESSEHTSITSRFIGTFRYSPPEQIQNDRNLDARADIYSLGVILYEMLSAADPFGLSTKTKNVSEASWLFAHSYEAPKLLRSQPKCEQLSPELEAVVMKCLQKRPDERFATVEELSQALLIATQSLIGTTDLKFDQTIIQFKSLQSPGSNDDTFIRPLKPIEEDEPATNQQPDLLGSDDDTIIRLLKPMEENEPAINQQPDLLGSDDDTIIRLLKPVEEDEPATNQQPDLLGSDDDTIIRLLKPMEENEPAINQQPDLLGSNDDTIIRPLKPVQENKPTTANQHQDENTLYQPRPATPLGQQPFDDTLYQPRQINQAGQRADDTQIQSRPVNQPRRPEQTQFQSPPVNQAEKKPEQTQFQQRSPHQGEERLLDDTIYQPMPDEKETNNKIPIFLLKIIVIFLVSGLAFGAGFYLYSYVQSRPQLNEQSLSKNNHLC